MIQLQFLNKLINEKDASLLLVNNLTEEFFSDYPNEFNFISFHLRQYGTIPDMASVLAKFPDFEVLEVTEPNKYLITELYKDRNTRFLAQTFNQVRKLLMDGKVEEAMALYSKASEDMVKATSLESVDILKDMTRYDDYIEKCTDFSKYYIRTGFQELDDIIGGWDRYEELATISARPGVGKSWILLLIAKAAAEQGLRVGIYSGEMSERKVGYRFDTLVGHISNSALMRGKDYVKADYADYINSLPQKFRGCVKVLTPAMISGPAGVNALRAFVEKENLDILCIDQHSLLDDDRCAKNPVERAANISKDLKNLQVLKKIPIIAVSQQNRSEISDRGATTANIAQSDRIAQDSTVIIFIEKKDGIMTLNLAKARDAVNEKKLHYAVDLDKGVFKFLPDEENPEECNDLREEYEYSNNTGEDVF